MTICPDSVISSPVGSEKSLLGLFFLSLLSSIFIKSNLSYLFSPKRKTAWMFCKQNAESPYSINHMPGCFAKQNAESLRSSDQTTVDVRQRSYASLRTPNRCFAAIIVQYTTTKEKLDGERTPMKRKLHLIFSLTLTILLLPAHLAAQTHPHTHQHPPHLSPPPPHWNPPPPPPHQPPSCWPRCANTAEAKPPSTR